MKFPRILLSLCLASAALTARAEEFLPGVQRILFLGDSITYSGQYVDVFEQFLFTEFPDRRFEVINCGLPSETVSGLSEEGHADGKFPRPHLHERLDRVLAQVKPDLVFACYGMNDGIYLPLDEARFKAFRDGILLLRQKVEAAGDRIIHLTPALFDPLPIRARLAPADKVDYQHPFEDYGEVLRHYAEWLIAQRAEGWRVIDVQGAMRAALEEMRKADPTFTFAKDGVHPDERGHQVIAAALLQSLAPEKAERVEKLTNASAARDARWEEFSGMVRKRGRILADAWLAATGHKRPGMGKGLPLDEATEQANALEKEIRELAAAVRDQ